MSARSIVAVAWDRYQGRTQALATILDGSAWYLRGRPTGSVFLPVRYMGNAIRMWRRLQRERPSAVVVIAPPVIAPLVAWFWCRGHHARLVIDCHTGAFHSWKWEWTTPVLRWICRRAAAALVHTEVDEALGRSWGAPVLLVPDDVPDPGQAAPSRQATGPSVVVAGSLDQNEPVAMTLAAAAFLPDVEVRLTGDPQRVPASVRRAAPPNAVFTGWLDYPRFLGELVTANVVAVFSTDPYIMNRAAFEAVGLRRPLVLSDLEGLRARFGQGALLSPNEPHAMAATLRQALQQQDELARRSAQLRGHLVVQHQQAIARLKTVLGLGPPPLSPAVRSIRTLGS